MYCTNCGSQIEEDFIYCNYCGNKILIETDEKKINNTIYIIYLPVLGIITGELAIFGDNIYYGLGIHIFNLLAIIFMIIFLSLDIRIKNVLQSLTLLIILRAINLSMPHLFTNVLSQYILIYGIMFIPIYSVIQNQQISYKELGMNFRKIYIYFPMALMIGSIMAIFEYKILPTSSINEIRFSNIIFISIVMFAFIGPVEELIFRSILQTRIEKVLGSSSGILLSGTTFGIMHPSYGTNEIIFATVFGIILGYIFHKTRSLPFTVSTHGGANIILYGILPKLIK